MAGEFTKGTALIPAIVGTLAKSGTYNKNLALIAKDSFIGVDTDGTPQDTDGGDETIGANGALIADLKVRTGKSLLIYDSSGNLLNTIPYLDLVNILDFTITAFYDLNAAEGTPWTTGKYYIATATGGSFTANYIYLKITTGSGWSEIVPFTKQQIYSVTDGAMMWWNGTSWEFVKTNVLLQTQTISSPVASVNITSVIDGTYNKYIVEFIDIVPSADNVSFESRISQDNGSNWKSGASDYLSNAHFINTANFDFSNTLGAVPSMRLSGLSPDGLSNVSDETYNGRLELYNPSATTTEKQFLGTCVYKEANSFLAGSRTMVNSYVADNAAYNAIQLFMSSGNIASGIIKIYGVK